MYMIGINIYNGKYPSTQLSLLFLLLYSDFLKLFLMFSYYCPDPVLLLFGLVILCTYSIYVYFSLGTSVIFPLYVYHLYVFVPFCMTNGAAVRTEFPHRGSNMLIQAGGRGQCTTLDAIRL